MTVRLIDADALIGEASTGCTDYVADELQVSRPTATSYLNQLADIGVVTKTKLGRDNFYINKRLFNLLMNAFHYEQFGEKKIIRTE